jgi:hypothetical protein
LTLAVTAPVSPIQLTVPPLPQQRPPAIMDRAQRLALELDQCISAVITAMRQNAKWAVVPGNYKVRVPRPATANTQLLPGTL